MVGDLESAMRTLTLTMWTAPWSANLMVMWTAPWTGSQSGSRWWARGWGNGRWVVANSVFEKSFPQASLVPSPARAHCAGETELNVAADAVHGGDEEPEAHFGRHGHTNAASGLHDRGEFGRSSAGPIAIAGWIRGRRAILSCIDANTVVNGVSRERRACCPAFVSS